MNWHIDLRDLQHGQWKVETTVGHIRTGKITNIDFDEVDINGRMVKWPKAVYMNDESDYIEWREIRSLTKLPRESDDEQLPEAG